MKCFWNKLKSGEFQDSLHTHITYHSSSTISMPHLNKCIRNALYVNQMVRKIELGPISKCNGPAWFDSKCLLYIKNKNQSITSVQKGCQE
jgi:hypothetical protein